MSLIEIKKVESKKDLKTFIDFHYDLYEGNEYDVPNLFSDEMNTLKCEKESLLTPINEHWTTTDTNRKQMEWIKKHLIK